MILTIVGSRETPVRIYDELLPMLRILHGRFGQGLIVRSGGADGMDSYAERACDTIGITKEIFLPWRFFNENRSDLYTPNPFASEIARIIHPSYDRLGSGAKKLHSRNVHQVMGKNLDALSDLVIAWTKDGKKVGGTRTAIVLAERLNIPVVNMANFDYNATLIKELRKITKCD